MRTVNPTVRTVSVSSSGPVTVDASKNSTFVFNLAANVTGLTVSNPVVGSQYTFIFEQNNVGGHTYSWPSPIAWTVGAPTLTTANTRVAATLMWDGTYWTEVSRAGVGEPLPLLNEVLTTKGDIIVSSGTTAQRLGVGPDGYVLTAASGSATGLTWSAVAGGGGGGTTINVTGTQPQTYPSAAKYMSSTYTAKTTANAEASGTPMVFPSANMIFDTDGYVNQANNSRFVAPKSGYYRMEGEVQWGGPASASGQYLEFCVVMNQAGNVNNVIQGAPAPTRYVDELWEQPTTGFPIRYTFTTGLIWMNQGDYLECMAWNSGSTDITGCSAQVTMSRHDGGVYLNNSTASPVLAVATDSSSSQVAAPATLTAVSASTLTTTFIAPASGRVKVRLSGYGYVAASAGNALYWGLVDQNGTQVGNTRIVIWNNESTYQIEHSATHEYVITGLTGGQQYTWRWAHYRQNANTTAVYTWWGSDKGPVSMVVEDATVGTPNESFPQNGITQPYLAVTSYTASNYTSMNTSGTLTTLDSTNLKVTFTAPASGRVVVGLNTPFYTACNTAGQACDLKIVDGSNTVVQGATARAIYYNTADGVGRVGTFSHEWLMLNLTPGQQYTWYLAYLNSCSTFSISPTTDGPITMTVRDAALSPNMTAQSANPFLLGSCDYNPVGTGAVSFTSTTGQVIDANNMKVTFVAPASGRVNVYISAAISASAANAFYLGLSSSSSSNVNVLGSWSYFYAVNTNNQRYTTQFAIAGLTPGTQYTWYLVGEASSGQTCTVNTGTSGYGALHIDVWDGTAGAGSVQTPPGLTTLGRLSAYLTSNVTVPNASWTQIAGWTVSDDPLGKWDSVNNNRYVVPATATYIITGTVDFSATTGAAGYCYAAVAVNGVRQPGRSVVYAPSASALPELQFCHQVRCNAGDAIALMVYQATGGTATIYGAGYAESSTSLQIIQVPDTGHVPSATSSSQVIGARLNLTTQQALASNGTPYVVGTGGGYSVDYDKGGFYSVSQPTRLTVPSGGGGTYRCRFVATMGGPSGAKDTAYVYVNGQQRAVGWADHSQTGWLTPIAEITLALNAGDYVEGYVNIGANNDLSVKAGSVPELTYLEVTRVNSVALTDPSTTKGDIIARSTGGMSRLAVGTDKAFLVADSTQALGVKWDYDAWLSFTPVVTSWNNDGALGNGQIIGRYKQIGKYVTIQIVLFPGSTTTMGSGGGLIGNIFPVAPYRGAFADNNNPTLVNTLTTGGAPSVLPAIFANAVADPGRNGRLYVLNGLGSSTGVTGSLSGWYQWNWTLTYEAA